MDSWPYKHVDRSEAEDFFQCTPGYMPDSVRVQRAAKVLEAAERVRSDPAWEPNVISQINAVKAKQEYLSVKERKKRDRQARAKWKAAHYEKYRNKITDRDNRVLGTLSSTPLPTESIRLLLGLKSMSCRRVLRKLFRLGCVDEDLLVNQDGVSGRRVSHWVILPKGVEIVERARQ